MKKLLALSLIGSSLLLGSNSAKADWDKWVVKTTDRVTIREMIYNIPNDVSSGVKQSGVKTYTIKLYNYNSNTGESSLINSFQQGDESHIGSEDWRFDQVSDGSYDSDKGQIKFRSNDKLFVYDINLNQWTNENYVAPTNTESDFNIVIAKPELIKTSDGNIKIEHNGTKILEKKADGSVHIGENSAVFKEEGGREKFWAQDANGKSIPIDITNGSKLLINGRDVEQSINNVGALSAALTGLPTVPTYTTLACGLGTGTHGGDFAFSGGCASKVNEKLSINYAASMTMPGQDYSGDLEDQFSARAGFVWKFGNATKPTQISMKDKKVMESKIESLEKKNKTILSKNQNLENKLSTLIARLEKIEKITLGESKSKDLGVYLLK